jgi:hypothetical protein
MAMPPSPGDGGAPQAERFGRMRKVRPSTVSDNRSSAAGDPVAIALGDLPT